MPEIPRILEPLEFAPEFPKEIAKGEMQYTKERPQGNYALPDAYATYGIFADRILMNKVDPPYLFHATRHSKLAAIKETGKLIAFPEKGYMALPLASPKIFATTNPAMAMHHSIYNGPHDTWEELEKDAIEDDPPILLQFDYINYYKNQPEELKRIEGAANRDFVDQGKGVPMMDIGVILGDEFPTSFVNVLHFDPGSKCMISTPFDDYQMG